jgi:hypothetical protein
MAYADASKASVRKDMRVRIPLPAPRGVTDKTVGSIHNNEFMDRRETVELARLDEFVGPKY